MVELVHRTEEKGGCTFYITVPDKPKTANRLMESHILL